MQGKEVFLKNKYINCLFIIFFLTIPVVTKALSTKEDDSYKQKISEYLSNNKEFASSFIQLNNNSLQEGNFFLKKNRLRIEYISPAKIVFVIKGNNAMYYNIELEEVEYFNPKDTIAKIFFDFFYNKNFLEGVNFQKEGGSISLYKTIKIRDEINSIKIIFEKSPIKLRKIEISNSEGFSSLTIINPNYNPDLDDKIFSLANPLLN